MKRYYFLLFPLLFCCITACNKCAGDKQKTVVLVNDPGAVNTETGKLIAEALEDASAAGNLVVAKDTLVATKFLLDFYRQNKFSVAWTDRGKLNRQGDTLFAVLKDAGAYGLIPDD